MNNIDTSHWETLVIPRPRETKAHVAALEGKLPDAFDRYDLSTKYGLSVAHYAATKCFEVPVKELFRIDMSGHSVIDVFVDAFKNKPSSQEEEFNA